jgi:hypothetical protein
MVWAEETAKEDGFPFHNLILPYAGYGRNNTSADEMCLTLGYFPSRSLTVTRTQVGSDT